MTESGPPAGNLDAILATSEHDRERLDSNALGAFSLTLLGVASVLGARIFVVTGDAAVHHAGPAVLSPSSSPASSPASPRSATPSWPR